MKILHTSDWHLGQNFYNYNRDDEHRQMCERLCEIAGMVKADAIVVAGDIFDVSQPSISSQDLFVQILMRLHRGAPGSTIVVIAGNHDSASRLKIHSPLWKLMNVHIVAMPKMTADGWDVDAQTVRINAYGSEDICGYVACAPFVSEGNYQRYVPDAERNEAVGAYHRRLMERVEKLNTGRLPVVLTAHLALSDSAGRSSAILNYRDVEDMGSGWDYLALGHIHRPSDFCDGRARYCGSPFPLSFDECYPHSVSVVEIERHGAMPKITTVEIESPVGVTSEPAKALELEDVVSHLKSLPSAGNGAYLRVNLLVDDFIHGEARKRIEDALAGKDYRFCGINAVRKTRENESDRKCRRLTTDELKEMDPLEVARQYYLKKYNTELPEQFRECLMSCMNTQQD